VADAFQLPIDDVLDEISAALKTGNRLVLAAPPGAGKTTKVPLHLLGSDWLGDKKIIMLEPRRIAARRAAERMASMLGERMGDTVGVRSRLDTRIGPKTKIEVVTEGVFTNLVTRDAELGDYGAVLFDEFHERSLDADLGLALAQQSQDYLNEDLRIVVMSATLDTEKVAGTLKAPVVQSEGRAYPVETRYLGRTQDRLEDQMAKAIRKALAAETGSILAFLPGAAEINRTAERLAGLSDDILICRLYGALPPKEQDDAIKPPPSGRRKVVLSTDIAESSLTIEGVRVVIDSGFARVPVYSPNSLGAMLSTVKASIANVDQRRGRAGRTEPGVCYRLWHEEENRGLPKAPTPELLNADLSSALLRLIEWGDHNLYDLNLLDYPPRGHFSAALDMLKRLEFIDSDDPNTLTLKGRQASGMPLHPRLSSLILAADSDGEKALAAQIAAMLSEQGAGGRSDDLSSRVSSFQRDGSKRASSLKDQAKRWAGTKAIPSGNAADIIAKAWPDRIAKRRKSDPKRYQLAGGGGVKLPDNFTLEGSEWIVVCETGGQSGNESLVRLAGALDERLVRSVLSETERDFAEFDPKSGKIKARRQKTLGEIVLSETPLSQPDNATIAEAVIKSVEENGLSALPGYGAIKDHVSRLGFFYSAFPEKAPKTGGTSEVLEAELISSASDWLAPHIETHGLKGIEAGSLRRYLDDTVDWELRQALQAALPAKWQAPSGRNVAIDYADEKAPLVSVRVQDLYGLKTHPTICDGRVPMTLSLLSPAQRPVAITKDLPGFWSGSYSDMRKDIKGRYPKHNWPEDPANATPPPPRNRK
jgi:ATP-dependent helicase HrpB